MKTIFTYLLSGLFTITIGFSYAQEAQSPQYISAIPNPGKSILISSADVVSSNKKTAKIVIDEKVSKAFESSFGRAEKVRWYEKSRKDLVKFIMDDLEHIALFNKDGSLFYHLSFGLEKNLPAEIKNLVNNSYPNYSISKVVHITQNGRNYWILNMDSDQYFKILNVEGGKIKEMNNFKIAGIAL